MLILAILFVLGMANFAMHQAIVESRAAQVPGLAFLTSCAARLMALLVELALLIAAMGLASAGWTGSVVVYAIYTCLNGLAAWLIATGRI